MKNGVIVVEGNIGAGKSTFSKFLADRLDALYEPEPDENTNPYLADYYEDSLRWAFNMQIFLLSRRWRAQRFAQQAVRHKGGFVVMDRSYYGDVCFANVQRDLGFFDERDYRNYMSIHTDMKAELEPPALVIHLDADPEICKERISKRMSEKAGRACESTIELDYLQRLNAEIKKMCDDMGRITWVLTIPWNAEKTQKDIAIAVLDIEEMIEKHAEIFPDFSVGAVGIGA